jgi:hypothetical protein
MPYCPKCLTEHREGVVRCSDCGVGLVGGAPPVQPAPERPDTEVVRLCRVADPSEADIIKAALAEAGIQSLVRQHGPMTGELARVVDGATHDYAIIYVTANRLREAQQLLDGLRSAQFEWPEGMEPDDSADGGENE